MSQRKVKWGQVRRYFRRREYTLRNDGGDIVIVAPPDNNPGRTRQTVRIGHRFCNHAGDELRPAHIAMIKRAFGVTREQMLDE